MTARIRTHALALLAITLPLVACAQSPSPAAPAAQAAAAPRAPAAPLVSGCRTSPTWSNRLGRAW